MTKTKKIRKYYLQSGKEKLNIGTLNSLNALKQSLLRAAQKYLQQITEHPTSYIKRQFINRSRPYDLRIGGTKIYSINYHIVVSKEAVNNLLNPLNSRRDHNFVTEFNQNDSLKATKLDGLIYLTEKKKNVWYKHDVKAMANTLKLLIKYMDSEFTTDHNLDWWKKIIYFFMRSKRRSLYLLQNK